MTSYDEDLMANKFFTSMVKKCPELYSTAATNRWTICVPRSGCTVKTAYTDIDFQNHVLLPVEGDAHKYRTVHGKELTVKSSTITTGAGYEDIRTVPILFEETFFNDAQESYRIICLGTMLEGASIDEAEQSVTESNSLLQSLDDCMDLLWGHTGSNKTQRHLDEVVELFNRSCDRLQGESLVCYVDAANAMFTKAMQIVLKDHVIKNAAKTDKAFLERIKVAVETYAMHGVYRKLFKGISACLATNDAKLNKITRNLAHVQLRDLSIRLEFSDNIPRARHELTNLVKYSTPMGKMLCVRRVIVALMQPTKRSKQNSPEHSQCDKVLMTTDDLLPILIFMIIKSQIANWSAHLCFMNTFRFSKSNNDDEFGFYLASIEAALEHLTSGQLCSDQLGSDEPLATRWSLTSRSPSGVVLSKETADNSVISKLFDLVRSGDIDAVRAMITRTKAKHAEAKTKLCHPLCSCDECERMMSSTRGDSGAVTAFSRDDRGCTALHIASIFGHVNVLELLIKHGGVVKAADYHGSTPLHLACQRGHQNVTLLLLHYNADPNVADSDGNTPLHLCAANGHEDCVKALVYYDQTSSTLDVNCANDFGDTPLHHAAKWGYENIIQLLLENNASVEARNRKKQTPVNCAHSMKAAKLLLQVAERATQENHYTKVPTPKQVSSVVRITRDKSPTVTALDPDNEPSAPRTLTLSPTKSKLDRVFRAVIDDDLPMVRYLLGWTSESESEDDESPSVMNHELCHPLCQCRKCQPVQRRTSFAVSRDTLTVHSANHDGLTTLHVAALHGQCNIAALLLKKGANVNARNRSMEAAPLHVASQYNKPKMVRLLLQHGAKVNQKDARWNMPLHFCAMNGCVEAATVLLQNGAGVEPLNYKGDTPLHEAARWNMFDMVQLLLRHGAHVRTRNKSQLTPLQLAQNDDVVEILEKALSDENSTEMLDLISTVKEKEPKSTSAKSQSAHARKGDRDARNNSGSEPSIDALFAAFEEQDLNHLREITNCIRKFDRRANLRQTMTRDRSAPRLDWLLKHQMAITNFDTSRLRRASTLDRSAPQLTDEIGQITQTTGAKPAPALSPVEMSTVKHRSPPESPTEADNEPTLATSRTKFVTRHQKKKKSLHDECENSNTESADELL